MKEILVACLRPFADLCTRLFQTIPLYVAQMILILVMMGLTIWVITLKEENPKTFPEAVGKKIRFALLRDLRFWAVLLLTLQCVLIIVFK